MKLKSILGSFFKGVIKATPIIGNVATEIIENKSDENAHSPSGVYDIPRILGYLIAGIVIISVIFGKLDVETMKAIFKQLNLYNLFN